jgi:sulfur carrier protein ThiS
MMYHGYAMEVHFEERDGEHIVEVKKGTTVREALLEAGLLPSMVIVSFQGMVLPHSTQLTDSVKLLVTTISSGG